MNRTKIVCTIGPASCDYKIIKEMVLAGMDVARFNMSHGTHEFHHNAISIVKQVRKELGLPVSIMIDTKGPEIRIRQFENGTIVLKKNDKFILTTNKVIGNHDIVSVTYSKLPALINKGDHILINDGFIELVVVDKNATDILTKVVVGGVLSNNKSINLPSVDLQMEYLSDNDKKDILFAVQEDADILSISFVNNTNDVSDVRKYLKKIGGEQLLICSKIESAQGVAHMDEIIDASDGVMVARGDLGVEVDFEKIPWVQKELIKRCNHKGKFTITATQMLESMIHTNRPTRAEISDVANAILDGTSALMLSGETSTGDHPALVVKTMQKIATECEKTMKHELQLFESNNVSESIGYAAADLAESLNAKCIICVTKTGHTAKCISRFRPNIAIIACTPNTKAYYKLPIYYGVMPVLDKEYRETDKMLESARVQTYKAGFVKKGDLVVQTSGSCCHTSETNTLHVTKI